MNDKLLHTLLDESLAYGPEFGPGFSSHLPMALHALHALGAGPERLRAFNDRYAQRLKAHAATPSRPLPTDWRDARGDFTAFDALRAHFAARLHEQGRDATLRAVLPALWPGAAGAAFHGLIRTAHAVQSGHAGELAAALAYWAARWQTVPAPPRGESDAPLPLAAWAAQVEAASLGLHVAGSSISQRIRAAVQTPAYATWADASALEDLATLSDRAADLYARSGNFTVLHVVTATRAARVLAPWTTAPGDVRQGLLRAVAAALLGSHLDIATPMPADAALPAWPVLIERAIASDDDHVIKLVHALDEACALHGEGARQRAAARALIG